MMHHRTSTRADDPHVEDALGDEHVPIPASFDITTYGADFAVTDLVRMVGAGAIYVPSFQRGYVWSIEDASRLVESLLLDLPIPGIFLAHDTASEDRLLMIDGQQRLKSLLFFYEGVFAPTGEAFALQGVQERFEGRTYETLSTVDQHRLNDALIHATVVRQLGPSNGDVSIYHIYERINRGGRALSPQEIRACIYHGSLNDLLRHLNSEPAWRDLFGEVHERLRDQELILRFLALYFHEDAYERPMRRFLNRYMNQNRDLSEQGAGAITSVFVRTVEAARRSLGREAFRPNGPLNASVLDAVMVGLARRLERGPVADDAALAAAYERLLHDDDFMDACTRDTASPDRVHRRIALATEAFATSPHAADAS